MTKSKQIPVAEIKEVFEFLEKANDLFHQPDNYKDSEVVEKFAEENYKNIHKLYYEVVWEWLPEEEKEKYENR